MSYPKVDSPTPPTRAFDVEYNHNGVVKTKTVQAAYVRQEGGLIEFKDASHGVVFMITPAQLVSISRQDASPVVNAIVDFAQKLRDKLEVREEAD